MAVVAAILVLLVILISTAIVYRNAEDASDENTDLVRTFLEATSENARLQAQHQTDYRTIRTLATLVLDWQRWAHRLRDDGTREPEPETPKSVRRYLNT